ncbi:hypothetical protein KUC62_28195 [Pseudomonas aeruginosa]|uniref:hypothetical protein n=1 Tax=Pseudomonas aeruginosa TaxID=287 RepID=UPI000D3C72CE|nr:hypothetical protein [Pseudomonas aeruginosa]MCV0038271.1 hypothetical protein [Pseudomonas aeruginosa]PTZ29284.1 hypothetical protein DB395_32270 [Pseudomonas aeruginosa]HCE5829218.1 hypothetical protein [Pseudomonas aeruginosa]HDV4151056.1 hypothetical protein [Pseudomonas aeruginosa]
MDKQSSTNNDVISVLEVWEAIGHDGGVSPSKGELLESLRHMAAICDAHGNDMPAQSAIDQRKVIADAITGALAFGALASRPPAEDHWLRPFYDLGAAEGQRTRDLAMLVRMLASTLKRHAPDSSLVERAANYLAAKGLVGTPLRSTPEPPPSPAHELDPLGLAPHAEAFNEAPDEAIRPEQAEAERPELEPHIPAQTIAEAAIEQLIKSGAKHYQEFHFDLHLDGHEGARPVVVTVAFSDGPSAHELRMKAEQERDAALARVAELEHVLRVVVNAADHGSWPTTVMHGIEKVREVLAGSAPPAKAQHSDQSELRRIAVALTNPLLNGQEASDLMVRYEALTMPDHIIALIDSQAQYIAPDELRTICMLVAEAGIKYGRGRDRAVASDECREVVDSVLPLEPSPSNSEQHCEPEIMAVAEGVLTFMRSEKEGSHCTCCNGPHIFCRYFEGMSDFDDITRKARFRNDLEGRTFRLVLELLPAALSGKEGV